MVGTAVADPDTLGRIISGEASQAGSKVMTPDALATRIAEVRANGSTVVFTSGSFESLDVQHLRALQRARAQGEVLVVAVNGDPSTGPRRAEMVAALRFVDYVTLFRGQSAARLIRDLHPDVII
jgi:D-beta-D-heptose 7-phosphate kinase/D-beta-D-heptose 1-phosphate adenosyltransferase